MRYLPFVLFAAGPAMAHPGAHVHPHGTETWLALAVGLTLAAGLGVVVWKMWR